MAGWMFATLEKMQRNCKLIWKRILVEMTQIYCDAAQKQTTCHRDQKSRFCIRTNYKRRYIQKLITNYDPLYTPIVHHQLEPEKQQLFPPSCQGGERLWFDVHGLLSGYVDRWRHAGILAKLCPGVRFGDFVFYKSIAQHATWLCHTQSKYCTFGLNIAETERYRKHSKGYFY